MPARTTVVVISKDRAPSLVRTLHVLRQHSPGVPVVVVDNGSTDGTAARVAAEHPEVTVLRLEVNAGSAGRTHGVRAARTPYVAFADDDSWWGPDSLDLAADRFDLHPRLGLLAARLVVEPSGRIDPVCEQMAASPLPGVEGIGPGVLGFVACGAVVRRSAYLAGGGFHPRFGVGGEEDLLAIDLTSAGWSCVYDCCVVAHHAPESDHPRPGRQRRLARNALWTDWLRRAPSTGRRSLVRALTGAAHDPAARWGALEAVAGLPWVLRERRQVTAELEARLALLDGDPPDRAWTA